MKIVRPDVQARESAIGELYFGAPIAYQYLATRPDTGQIDVCLVDFEPGGRNRMHTHVYDQILFVTAGRGIVATRDGEHVVVAGDTLIIPAGEPHWHGATASDSFSHLCIEKHNNEITIVDED
jgi:quercetin dioxygenase-like cupin family protein